MLLDEMHLFDNDEIHIEEVSSEFQEKKKKKTSINLTRLMKPQPTTQMLKP